MTKIIFAMYNPETDCVKVSLNEQIRVSFDCQKCNATAHLDCISYKTCKGKTDLYAMLATRNGGLQEYVEAMGEFN